MSAHDEHINLDPYELLPGLQAGQYKVLRQSTIGTADTCLTRLEFDLDPRIPYSTGEARAVGTGYHAGLEHYYSIRQWIETAHPDVSVTDIGPAGIGQCIQVAFETFDLEAESPGFEWIEGKDSAHAKIETMLRGYFAGAHYWPEEYKVEGVELTFLLPLGGHWITKGTIDLVLRDPNGWIIAADHKSAKRPWKKGKESPRSTVQPSWYLPALRRLFPDNNVSDTFVFDIMTYKGDFERRTIQVLPQHEAAIMKKAERVCALIDAGGPFPPNTSSFLCDARWCDHWQRCPFGEQFDSGVAVERAVTISS